MAGRLFLSGRPRGLPAPHDPANAAGTDGRVILPRPVVLACSEIGKLCNFCALYNCIIIGVNSGIVENPVHRMLPTSKTSSVHPVHPVHPVRPVCPVCPANSLLFT